MASPLFMISSPFRARRHKYRDSVASCFVLAALLLAPCVAPIARASRAQGDRLRRSPTGGQAGGRLSTYVLTYALAGVKTESLYWWGEDV